MPEALRSTPVEQPLPQGEQKADQHGNLHHNVPESRCGSDSEGNLSVVWIPRHNEKHDWVKNRHPAETMGTAALISITHPNVDKRMDAGQLHEFLLAARSRSNYWEKATVSTKHPDSIGRMTQDLHHTTLFLHEELNRVRAAIAFIRGEATTLPEGHHDFLEKGKKFFGVQTAAEVIEGVLTEKNNKEFSWVKPMRFDIRQRLENRALNREGTPSKEGTEYLWALDEHESSIRLQLKTIGDKMAQLYEELRILLSGMRIHATDNVA